MPWISITFIVVCPANGSTAMLKKETHFEQHGLKRRLETLLQTKWQSINKSIYSLAPGNHNYNTTHFSQAYNVDQTLNNHNKFQPVQQFQL
jgi:hypothetical protein